MSQVFFDVGSNVFMNFVPYGISCLEYDTINKCLLLCCVVFKAVCVVAIVGSVAVLWSIRDIKS